LLFVLDSINSGEEKFTILTPRDAEQHGCQVSLAVHKNAKQIFDKLLPLGIFADWREPDVIRIAPVPLYNSFSDIFEFGETFQKLLNSSHV
jgi:kynureninase